MIAPLRVLVDQLRIQSAQLARLQYPLARGDESGCSQRNLALRGNFPDRLESLGHYPVETAIDLVLGPEEVRKVLHGDNLAATP